MEVSILIAYVWNSSLFFNYLFLDVRNASVSILTTAVFNLKFGRRSAC